MSLLWLIPFCIGAYFIGNINFAIIYSRVFRRRDIRTVGSGNAGATNMLRVYGFKTGLAILLLDVLKALLVTLAAYLSFGVDTESGLIALYAVGLACVVGHCFPVLYRFKGGKGAACVVGVFLVANPVVAFVAFLVGLIYVVIFEYGAISSLFFVTVMVIIQSINHGGGVPLNVEEIPIVSDTVTISIPITIILFCFMILVWFMHRKNIQRLLTGEESRASILKRIQRKKK